MSDARQQRLIGSAIAGLGPVLVAGALVGVRGEVDNANVALVLVLVVVGAAVTGGWQAGALAAVMSTLSFDFFHTKPYLSLTIASADDVETTLLLLLVGVGTGLLASHAQRAAAAAETGSAEIRRIHRVAELAARGAPATDVLLAAQDELSKLLELRGARFEAPPFEHELPRIERNGAVTGVTERHFARRELELPREGVQLPVLARGRSIGRFVLVPTPETGVSLEQCIVATAIADHVGAALVIPQRNRELGDG